MSQQAQSLPKKPPPADNKVSTAQERRSVVTKLDSRLAGLGERILPKQPYLVSAPSDVPYRHSVRFVHTWHLNSPFAENEERLQYMSLLSHQDEDETLLKVEGGWADESGNMLDWEKSPYTETVSRPQTPVEPGQRKKISLKDYKSKDKSNTGTGEVKVKTDSPRSLPTIAERPQNPSKTNLSTTNSAVSKSNTKTDTHRQPHEANPSVPRPGAPRAPRPENGVPETLVKPEHTDSPRPTKRRRLSLESASSKDKVKDREVKKEHSKNMSQDSKDLPLLLSPTIPSAEKARTQKLLPDLLSPKLPPSLEKIVSAPHRTDEVRYILKAGIGSPLQASAIDRKGSDATRKETPASRVRADSQQSTASAINTPQGLSPAIKPLAKISDRIDTPSAGVSPRPRMKHIVALKYGKKNRKRVEMLLKFATRIKKAPEAVKPTEDSKEVATQPVPPTTTADSLKISKKRVAETSLQAGTAKKPKPIPSAEKSLKPSIAVTESPSRQQTLSKSPALLAVTSTPKPQVRSTFSTPKEIKSVAMQRVASSEVSASDARTPQMDVPRTSTPLGARHPPVARTSPNPAAAPSSTSAAVPTNTVKAEDRAAWNDLHDRHFAIGRTLKREGQSLAGANTPKDHILSIVLLIEALICFMINSGAQSHARPSTDPGWSTIIPYYLMVANQSRRYRHLYGLVIQLGAVCRQFVHQHDMIRLARDPLPDENCGSAPTPGSDGITKTTEDPERYKRKYIEFRDGLVQNARDLQTAWLEGSKLLSLDILERDFPKTWKRRSRDVGRRILERERFNPKELTKEFYLPLDVTTNAFEAANFALTFLAEWTEKEGIVWRTKIEL